MKCSFNSSIPSQEIVYKNVKECNNLDTEMNRIQHELANNNIQAMYMINPNNPSSYNQSKYKTYTSSESRCTNEIANQTEYLINPNAQEDFTKEEEEYVMYPQSNIPIKKSDLEERRQIKIYPHMFQSHIDSDKPDTRQVLGAIDYPIPMRFQLRNLQDRKSGQNNGGVDYDLRLKYKNNILPKGSRSPDDDAYFQIREPNTAIIHGQQHRPKVEARTIGAPSADKKDFTCSQIDRSFRQFKDVSQQSSQRMERGNFYIDCEGCPREQRELDRQADLVKPMSKYEKKIFGTTIDRRRPVYQTYPSEAAMKTSFFGLGPAIPPPNPLLLSNVPSNLLLSKTNIVDPENNKHKVQNLQISLSDTDVYRGRDTQPYDPSITNNKVENFIGEGQFDGSNNNVLSTGLSGQATPMSEIMSRIRPSPTNVFESGQKNEYSRRNKTLETDLKDKINKIVEQQRQIMMQISDIRHLVPELKQRELLAKEISNIQDIHYSINKFGNSMYLLNQIRQLQSYLQTQQKRLIQRLEDVMPTTEFLKYQTKLQNKIAFYQSEIKRYHAMPEDNEIQAFTQVNFSGDVFKMKMGFYDHPHVGGLQNNALKSLKIGKGVTVVLFNRANRKGKILVYHGPRRIPNIPVLWTNNISGIEVINKITIQVHLFDAPFFQGGNVRVGAGFYDYPKVAGIGQSNLKSLVIPKGLHVRLYSRPSRKGETIDFLGPQRLSFLPSGWNKKVFGIEITSKIRDY